MISIEAYRFKIGSFNNSSRKLNEFALIFKGIITGSHGSLMSFTPPEAATATIFENICSFLPGAPFSGFFQEALCAH